MLAPLYPKRSFRSGAACIPGSKNKRCFPSWSAKAKFLSCLPHCSFQNAKLKIFPSVFPRLFQAIVSEPRRTFPPAPSLFQFLWKPSPTPRRIRSPLFWSSNQLTLLGSPRRSKPAEQRKELKANISGSDLASISRLPEQWFPP